jgi:hypothetical protein
MDDDHYYRRRTSTGTVLCWKPRPRYERYCRAGCGRKFLGFAEYCPECTAERRRARAAAARARRVAKLSKQRAAARDDLRCEACGTTIWGAKRARSGPAYCSSLCRVRAWRNRQRQ